MFIGAAQIVWRGANKVKGLSDGLGDGLGSKGKELLVNIINRLERDSIPAPGTTPLFIATYNNLQNVPQTA